MGKLHHLRKLNEEDLDYALMVLAEQGGNAVRAREQLVELWGEEKAPAHETLRDWRRIRHVDRYHDIAAGLDQARRDKRITQGFREIVQQSQDVIASSLNRLQDELHDIPAKDLAKTAQQLSVVSGIGTEKALLLEGRPTQISETRNPDWYAEQMEKLGLSVEGEAEEITDAEVCPDHSDLTLGPGPEGA